MAKMPFGFNLWSLLPPTDCCLVSPIPSLGRTRFHTIVSWHFDESFKELAIGRNRHSQWRVLELTKLFICVAAKVGWWSDLLRAPVNHVPKTGCVVVWAKYFKFANWWCCYCGGLSLWSSLQCLWLRIVAGFDDSRDRLTANIAIITSETGEEKLLRMAPAHETPFKRNGDNLTLFVWQLLDESHSFKSNYWSISCRASSLSQKPEVTVNVHHKPGHAIELRGGIWGHHIEDSCCLGDPPCVEYRSDSDFSQICRNAATSDGNRGLIEQFLVRTHVL